MLYDKDQIEIRPVISGGSQAEGKAQAENHSLSSFILALDIGLS